MEMEVIMFTGKSAGCTAFLLQGRGASLLDVTPGSYEALDLWRNLK
jgi:hypothetical protein